MRRALGHLQFINPDGTQVTFETFTCSHCNSIVRMPHPNASQAEQLRVKDIRRCHQCDALTCPKCAKLARCTPFERQLEAIERGNRLLGG
jgi:hypothetical protein